jgi:VCBS repeat-containing protein
VHVTGTTNAATVLSIDAIDDDSDTNGAPLTIVSLNLAGTLGSATIDPVTGEIDYSPNGAFAYLSAGETATDTFRYTVSDGLGDVSTATVTITITGINVPPVAVAENYTIAAYQFITVTPTALDTDANRDDILTTIAVNGAGAQGIVSLNTANGQVVYNPNGAFDYLSAGETATDTFQYTITDNHGATSTGTITITITGVNVAPVAHADTASTDAYDSVAINAAANDTDLNRDDVLTVTALNLTSTRGTAAIDPATGDIDYSPNGAFDYLSVGETAIDALQYTVSDGHGGSNVATVMIAVSGVNVPPVAVAETYIVNAYQAIGVSPTALDSDPNADDSLTTIAFNAAGTKGTVSLVSMYDELVYDPNGQFDTLSAGETATDIFHYTITDNHGATSIGTITITITGVNEPPVAHPDTVTTAAYSNLAINVLANDTDINRDDRLTITALNLTGTKGTATIDPVTGDIDYSPNGAFNYLSLGETATDRLVYTVSDEHGASSTASVTITVTGVNVAPIAAAESFTVSAYQPITINPSRYDTDANYHSTLSTAAVNAAGTLGTVTLSTTYNDVTYNPNGAFDYLSAGETATDTFHYTVSDNYGATSTGAITISITGINEPPVAHADAATAYAYSGVAINALANDTDINRDDRLTITALNLTGTKGAATIDPTTGDIDYSPNGAFNTLGVGQTATDTLAYTISDGHGGTSTSTVTITVTDIDAPPVAVAESYTTSAYQYITLKPTSGDTDPYTNPHLDVIAVNTTGTVGNVGLETNYNEVVYTPTGQFDYLSAGETATDSFQYTITDNHGVTSTGTITVTITGVNLPPAAHADTATTNAYAAIAINALANDTDINRDDVLTITALDLTGIKGTATIDPTTGDIDYSPNGAFDYLSVGESATDTLKYTMADGHGGTSTNTVTITVTGVNVPPVAVAESYTTNAYQYITLKPSTSDTDVNADDHLDVVAVGTVGTLGNVGLETQYNEVVYDPAGKFDYLSVGETATDTFQYTASDNHGATSTATITITITGVNVAPYAHTATATTNAYAAVAINALSKDTDVNRDDTLAITALNLTGTKGTATIDPVTGNIDYSPNGAFDTLSAGQTATDTLQYTISDNHGATSTSTVTITITGVNVPPVAVPESYTTSAYQYITLTPTRSDTDINASDNLTVTAINTAGTLGNVGLETSYNEVVYSPNGQFDTLSAGETATDTFQYTVSDNHGATSTSTITVTITGVNEPPVAHADTATTFSDEPVTLDVLAGDTDINRDDVLTVSSVNLSGTQGTVTIGTNGSVTYTPAGADASLAFGTQATDSFVYTISDGHGGTSSATVTVTVNGAPPAVSDLLGAGYLSTVGSELVNAAGDVVRVVSIGWAGTDYTTFAPADLTTVNYQQTMQEMVQAGFNTIRIPWSDALLTASPGAGSINYSINPDLQGLTSIQVLQKIVAYAGQIGLKIIFDHHNDEGAGGAPHNGLWYDVGGASDGTDGAGHTGTVSQQTFLTDWQAFAQLWAGNSTVIGFDLANEPNAATWAGPSTTSIQTMATTVGDAIQTVDPGALIIVESPASSAEPEGNLSDVAADPVVLTDADKIVYSVHEYPQSVDPAIFSGNPAQYIQQMNNAWGYLITDNIAPVWIGETGSSLATASDQLWAQTLANYVNGDYAAEGGPSATDGQQGVSTDWWAWANNPTGVPDGLLESGDTLIKQDQFAIVQQLYPLLTSPTAATMTVDNSLVLDMAEEAYDGNAQFQVYVDGVAVGGVQTVSAINGDGQVQQFFLSGDFGVGTHQVTVTFLNDAANPNGPGDRNLYVKGIVFDGTAQPVANGTQDVNGSLSYAVTATGTVATATAPDTLILQLTDTSANGGSVFAVYADGARIGGTETLTTAGAVQTFALDADLGPGQHSLDIRQLDSGGDAPYGGPTTIQTDTIDYDGALQTLAQTNTAGGADQDYTVSGPSILNDDAVYLGNDTASAVLTQPGQMVFLADGTHAIENDASSFTLQVAGGSATLVNFDPNVDQIDLIGGAGGYASAAAAASAVVSDGNGGAALALGAGSLDFVGVLPGAFAAKAFLIN